MVGEVSGIMTPRGLPISSVVRVEHEVSLFQNFYQLSFVSSSAYISGTVEVRSEVAMADLFNG